MVSRADDVHDILGLDEDDRIGEALEQDTPDARLDREALNEHYVDTLRSTTSTCSYDVTYTKL